MSGPSSARICSTDTPESSSWEAASTSGSERKADTIHSPSDTINLEPLGPDNTDIASYSELLSHFDAFPIIKDAILSRFGTFRFISSFTARFSDRARK